MRVDEAHIIRHLIKLVGFNMDTTNAVGEISLLVYPERVNLNTHFSMLDCPLVYNVIFVVPMDI